MTVPAYSTYSNRPRVFCRDTDKTALTARTNDVNGWKTLWDNEIIPKADQYVGQADSTIGGSGNPGKFMILAFAGWIENNSSYKSKAISAAVWLANNNPPNPTNANGRDILLSLAIVFDFLYPDMSSSDRTLIANEIVYWCTASGESGMSASPSEWMDGFSGIDQMCQLAGSLAIFGFHSQAQSLLTESLEFFYGPGANQGRIEMARYQYAGGGAEKGGTYFQLGCRGELASLLFITNGTTIDAWTQESSWASKIWEWVLWTQYRGPVAQDHEAHGDTNKVSAPRFMLELRWILGMLATRYPNTGGLQGGQMMRWLYDQYDSFQTINPDNNIFDVILLDRAAVAPVNPINATTEPARGKMFNPPGVYFYRESAGTDEDWDYEKSTWARISARKWFWQGHFHLDAGSVQIVYKGDVLLLAPAGAYDLSVCTTCHNNNALQRSWLQSMCPLVIDPSQTYHKGNILSTNLSANDGGQHWRKWVNSSGTTVYDPNNVFSMQNDGGGQAWRRCEAFDELKNNSSVVFLRAKIRNAYRKFITDPQRCSILDVKYLIIRPTAANGLTDWALLYYARIVKADPDWVTTVPLHFYDAVTTTSYGFHSRGYNAVNSITPAGKLWVDIRNISAYTLTNATPGSGSPWGADQFKVLGTGSNYPPSEAANSRKLRDIKRNSLYWKKTTQVQEEHYVCLMMPTASGASEPATSRAWVTDAAQPNHYGITLNGTETYLVHRTLDEVVHPGGAADTTPPALATGITVTPKNAALLARWTDPADSDLSHIEVYQRTSAI